MKTLKDRRDFLKFMGYTGVTLGVLPNLAGCSNLEKQAAPTLFTPLGANSKDEVNLAPGLNYSVLIEWGQDISPTHKFGDNNDYIAFFPQTRNTGLLWVNHESVHPLFASGFNHKAKKAKTRAQVDIERKEVGGSIIEVRRQKNGQWEFVNNSAFNRRLDGTTRIPFSNNVEIRGRGYAIGTFGNCAGGVTPWGSVLTAEENYHNFYGEISYDNKGKEKREASHKAFQWEKFYDESPEHFGWVVEVNMKTGDAKKLIGLGRCAHECATVHRAKNGKLVVYTGDDKENECIYKFISDSKNSLETGELFVADTKNGKWISLDVEKQPVLKNTFKDQLEVLIRLREAAKLVGGTPQDRPEDIEIDPKTGNVFVTLTNNRKKLNLHGSILKIEEDSGDHSAMKFKSSTFVEGGSKSGLSSPDNLVFDPKGNLWVTSDISGSVMNKGPYKSFGNNGLYYIPMSGPDAGKVIQVASAPIDAEFTGPCFSPDGKTLFLSVQHPGSRSKSLKKLTSNWPHGGNNMPKSAVITITGSLMNQLMS